MGVEGGITALGCAGAAVCIIICSGAYSVKAGFFFLNMPAFHALAIYWSVSGSSTFSKQVINASSREPGVQVPLLSPFRTHETPPWQRTIDAVKLLLQLTQEARRRARVEHKVTAVRGIAGFVSVGRPL